MQISKFEKHFAWIDVCEKFKSRTKANRRYGKIVPQRRSVLLENGIFTKGRFQ